ncbi:NS4 protein [Wad Medani virus]|uniref:NS4 protein n=1 Tax=Wad Medani virus TaxID=40067 RepID=A0A0H4MK95_9REOV|nr:NS4 protein [Wad Medani virus]AKP24082.1 NS4 protein [Wad Medani virus]
MMGSTMSQVTRGALRKIERRLDGIENFFENIHPEGEGMAGEIAENVPVEDPLALEVLTSLEWAVDQMKEMCPRIILNTGIRVLEKRPETPVRMIHVLAEIRWRRVMWTMLSIWLRRWIRTPAGAYLPSQNQLWVRCARADRFMFSCLGIRNHVMEMYAIMSVRRCLKLSDCRRRRRLRRKMRRLIGESN